MGFVLQPKLTHIKIPTVQAEDTPSAHPVKNGGIPMAVFRVVTQGLKFGLVFAVLGFLVILKFEQSFGTATPIVFLNIICVGVLFGGIAGTAQSIVEAVG